MSGDACSVMGVCSLLLMMCLHERKCEYHSIEEGPKLLLACSSCHARKPHHDLVRLSIAAQFQQGKVGDGKPPQDARHGLSHEVKKSGRNLPYQGALYPHLMVLYDQSTTEQEANHSRDTHQTP